MKQAVCLLIPDSDVPEWYVVVSRPDDHSRWGMPGGKVDPGETLVQAVIREAFEEIDLVLTEKDVMPVHTSVCKGETDYEVTTFLHIGKRPHARDLMAEEGLRLGYCTKEELCSDWSPFAEYNQRVFAERFEINAV